MNCRRIAVALHWLVFVVILAMVKSGTATPWVPQLFVGAVALWVGMTLSSGLLGRPDPKLSPKLHRAYPWMHRTLHTLLALAILFQLIGQPLLWLAAWMMLLVTLGAGTVHGVFQLWRHPVPYDNALGPNTPRVKDKWL